MGCQLSQCYSDLQVCDELDLDQVRQAGSDPARQTLTSSQVEQCDGETGNLP